jgi:hypothetical protein
MSKNTRDSRHPSGGVQADMDTKTYKQRMGGDDPPAPRDGPSPRLPHERDESAKATGDRGRENPPPSERQISQAEEDVEEGLVDTERKGIPNDVPTRKRT